jgi:hypothetical protein
LLTQSEKEPGAIGVLGRLLQFRVTICPGLQTKFKARAAIQVKFKGVANGVTPKLFTLDFSNVECLDVTLSRDALALLWKKEGLATQETAVSPISDDQRRQSFTNSKNIIKTGVRITYEPDYSQ